MVSSLSTMSGHVALTGCGQFGKRVGWIAGFINNVNTIFGESHPTRGDVNTDPYIVNVTTRLPGGTLTAYAHLIELEDTPGRSHRNLGLRYGGKHAFNDEVDLLYTGEYAEQSDYKGGASIIDSSYYFAEVGVRCKRITSRVGFELLGSNDGAYGFSTPFATLHKFNGWTDLFLTTPDTGLEDLYVSVSAGLWGFKAKAVYHDFSADANTEDLGNELDLQVARTFHGHYTAVLKYADFSSDSDSLPETTKLWGILQLIF